MRSNQQRANARRRSRERSLSDVTFVERIHINTDQRVVRAPPKRRATGDWSHNQSPTAQLTSKQRLASRVYNLSLDVAALQQELAALSLHRSLLRTRASFSRQRSSEDAAVNTTKEYWEVFACGFQPADSRQKRFLRSILADTFQLELTRCGSEDLLQQWQLYTEYFAISHYKLHSVRVVATEATTGSCVTRSDGVFCGSITRRTLEKVFPAVLRDPQLTQQLLGEQISTPITFTLHYDSDGKWTRHETETDFVHALAQALGGDIVRAAQILLEANVSDASVLRKPHQEGRATRAAKPWYLAHVPVAAEREEKPARGGWEGPHIDPGSM